MTTLILILSFISSIFTLIAYFFNFYKEKKFQHIVYNIIIIFAVGVSVYYWQILQEKNKIIKTAKKILLERDSRYHDSLNDAEFIQATLSFLERNKETYPDTYKRAIEICEYNSCNRPQYKNDKSEYDEIQYEYNQKKVATSYTGILKGIGMLES